MKLFFRLFWLLITQSRRSRAEIMGTCETTFHVWPNDLDLFLHVNNGVYLTYADLARTDMMLRSDTYNKIKQAGWYPVVAAETIRFRKSLKLGQGFTIKTRILGWSERAIYLEHEYRSKGESVATALIDARFLARSGGRVDTKTLLSLLGMDDVSPPLPEHVRQWVESVKSLDEQQDGVK